MSTEESGFQKAFNKRAKEMGRETGNETDSKTTSDDPTQESMTTADLAKALEKSNDARLSRLAEVYGVQAQPITWLGPRVILLCDLLLGERGAIARDAFELNLQKAYVLVIDKIESEVRERSISAPVTGQARPSGLIVP